MCEVNVYSNCKYVVLLLHYSLYDTVNDVYTGLVRLSDDIIQKRTRLQLKTSDFVSPDGKDFLSSLNFFFLEFLVFVRFFLSCAWQIWFLYVFNVW